MAIGFFGREAELALWRQILADPRGQIVLVIGHSGMGKTELLEKMAEMAIAHPDLQCGAVREEVTKNDSASSILQLLLSRAYEAARAQEGSFAGSRARQQWKALLNVVRLGDLVMSLARDPVQNARVQFIEMMSKVSGKMPENGRAVILIDPEKYLQSDSDQDWSIIARELPSKIKLVFAQRSDDVLPNSTQFMSLEKSGLVVRLPPRELGAFDDAGFAQFLDQAAAMTGRPASELEGILSRYDRHPYAVSAAVELLQAGADVASLPADPSGVAAEQLRRIKLGGATGRDGASALRLFEAYSTFDISVPEEVIDAVAGITAHERKALLADPYLGCLIRAEGNGHRVYHAILREHIESQITSSGKKEYHRRAASHFREMLRQAKNKGEAPDPLAVEQLPDQMMMVDGPLASAITINDECLQPLLQHKQWDRAIKLGELAAKRTSSDEKLAAFIALQLGEAYRMRERFAEAEKELAKAATLFEKLLPGSPQHRAANISLGWTYLAAHARDHAPATLQKAETYVGRARNLAHGAPSELTRVMILQISAAISARRGRFPDALGLLGKAIDLCVDSQMKAAFEKHWQFLSGRKVPPTVTTQMYNRVPQWSDPNHTCRECGSYYQHPFAGSAFVSSCAFNCQFCGSIEAIDHYFRDQSG